MAVSAFVTGVLLVLPWFFSLLSQLCRYGDLHERNNGANHVSADQGVRWKLYVTLLQTFILQLVVVYVVSAKYWPDTSRDVQEGKGKETLILPVKNKSY